MINYFIFTSSKLITYSFKNSYARIKLYWLLSLYVDNYLEMNVENTFGLDIYTWPIFVGFDDIG